MSGINGRVQASWPAAPRAASESALASRPQLHSLAEIASAKRRQASRCCRCKAAQKTNQCHLEHLTNSPSGGRERLHAQGLNTGRDWPSQMDKIHYYATEAGSQTSRRRRHLRLLPFKNLKPVALTPAQELDQQREQHKQRQRQQQQQSKESTIQTQQLEKVHKATSTPTAASTANTFTTATATCAATCAPSATRATKPSNSCSQPAGAVNSHLSPPRPRHMSAGFGFGGKTAGHARSRMLAPTLSHWTLPVALTLIFIVCVSNLIFVSILAASQQGLQRERAAARALPAALAAGRADEPAQLNTSSGQLVAAPAREVARNQRGRAAALHLADPSAADGLRLQMMADSQAAAESQFGLRTRLSPPEHAYGSTKSQALPAAAAAAAASTKSRQPQVAPGERSGQLELSYRQFGTTRTSFVPASNRTAASEEGQWIPIVRSSEASNFAHVGSAGGNSSAATVSSNGANLDDNQRLRRPSDGAGNKPLTGERVSSYDKQATARRQQQHQQARHATAAAAAAAFNSNKRQHGSESRVKLYASLDVQPRQHHQMHNSDHRPHHHRRPHIHLPQAHQYHFRRRPRLNSYQPEQANELGSFNAGKMYKRVLLCDKTLVSLDYVHNLEPEPRPFASGPIYKTTTHLSAPAHGADSDSANLVDEVLNDLGDNLIDLDGQYSSISSKQAEVAANSTGEAQPSNSANQQQQPGGSLGRQIRADPVQDRTSISTHLAQQPKQQQQQQQQQSGSAVRGLDGGAHFDALPVRDSNSTSSAPVADKLQLRLGASESIAFELRGSGGGGGGGGGGGYLLNDHDPLVRCDMWDLEKGLKSRKPPEHLLRIAIKADFDTVRDAINRCRQLSEKTLPAEDEYRDGLEIMSTEDLISLFSMKRGLIPGTKWCGLGDQANSYNDLGPKHRIDICCRAHDHCPIRSKPFRNDYGVLNIGLYTKSHCDCDADFYRCLREVRSRAADMLGNLYFNVMKLQCMREERLKVCREMKPIALGFERCIRYEDSPMKTVFKFTTPPVAY